MSRTSSTRSTSDVSTRVTPPDDLSHLQIVALAGEFYAEMVATHRDEPGRAIDWKQSLEEIERKKRLFGPVNTHLRTMFGKEADAFLRRRGVHLVGDRMENFIRAYVEAKERASQTLMSAANNNYEPVDKAPYYPKFDRPKSEQQFNNLWSEFCKAKMISAGTRKKWEPYFAGLLRKVGSRDVSRVTEQHLLDSRNALLASKLSPISVKNGHIAAARSFFGWSKQMQKLPTDPSANVVVVLSDMHKKKMRGFTDKEADIILAAALAPMSELIARRTPPHASGCLGSARTRRRG